MCIRDSLYWYSMGGNLVKQVTKGAHEVESFLGYDEADGSFYFISNEESPMQQAVYKIDRKGKKTKLSQKAGMNSALFSPTMRYYINTSVSYTHLDVYKRQASYRLSLS